MTDISFYYISLSYLYTSMSCLRQNKTLARFVTAVYKKLLGLFGYIEGIFIDLNNPTHFRRPSVTNLVSFNTHQ